MEIQSINIDTHKVVYRGSEKWYEYTGKIRVASEIYNIKIRDRDEELYEITLSGRFRDKEIKRGRNVPPGKFIRKTAPGHRITTGVISCLHKMGRLPEDYTQNEFECGDEVFTHPVVWLQRS